MTTAAQNSKQILAQKGTAATPSVSFLGGNASGMYSAGTNQLGFSTAGVNAVTIDASQNVTVTGSFITPMVVGGTTASSSLTLKSTSGVGTSDSILFKVGNNGATTAMTVDTSGNVGIGTSSPSTYGRCVSVAVSDYQAAFSAVSTGSAANWARMDWKNQNIATTTYIYKDQAGLTGFYNEGAYPLTFGTNNTERMRIDSSGNVGIGTASPTAGFKLNISDTTAKMQMTSTTGTNIAYSSWNNTGGAVLVGVESSTGGSIFAGTGAYSAVFGHGGGYPVAFATSNTERMRIDSSGNVGVGTGSPTTKLNVVSAINGGIAVTDGTVNTIIYSSTGGVSSIGTTTNHAVQLYTNNAARVTIDTSGNVGIGCTPNASAILDAQSTTKGVRFPNMTTTQKNAVSSPAAGLVVFDTTLAKLCVYSGSAWQTITSI